MTESLQAKLQQIDQLKAEIDAMEPMTEKSRDELWQKYRLEWNYNSNHIEGNTLSLGETTLLLIHDQISGDHTAREIDEMRGHDAAIKLVDTWSKDTERIISQSDLRSLNELLLVKPFYSDAQTSTGQKVRKQIIPGQYKSTSNHVVLQSGEIFKYAEPEEVQAKMDDLFSNYLDTIESIHPVLLAAKLHYEFVLIHPFDDGNGRVSRLLMNYHLLRSGLAPIIIKSADKQNYLRALNKADSGDFDAFAIYIADEAIWSLELMLKAYKGESVEEDEDWKKKLELIQKNTSTIDTKLKTASQASVNDIILNSVIPLTRKIEEEFAPFQPLFAEINLKIKLTSKTGKSIILKPFIGHKERNSITIGDWSRVDIEIQLENLKRTDFIHKSLRNKITFSFKSLNYNIRYPKNVGANFKYGRNLTEVEIQKIINNSAQYFTEAMENLTKK